jgi:hypothetical protein
MCQSKPCSDCESVARSYITLSGLPGVELPCDEIKRIDLPPIEFPGHDDPSRLPIEFHVVKAIRVLMKDGRVFWSNGDRSWCEKNARKQFNQAICRALDARHDLRRAADELRQART